MKDPMEIFGYAVVILILIWMSTLISIARMNADTSSLLSFTKDVHDGNGVDRTGNSETAGDTGGK